MRPYDIAGVGVGPFNLSLAALAEPLPDVSALFLDEEPEFRWHPGMLIEGATLQVPFLADLVTLADPTSRWSFLSYLHAHERLFPFYFAERFQVPRREYEHYCRWVAASLPSCRFGSEVTGVRWEREAELFRVEFRSREGTGELAARNVVLGLGTEPVLPGPLRALDGKEVFHSASYLDRVGDLSGAGDITVLGSGQSGAEVFLDLLRRAETGTRLRWLTRSPAFAPMEYSKLGLEHFTPDYTRYFQGLPQATRDRLWPAQWQLHKAISADTIAAIFDLLYERGAGGVGNFGGGAPDVTMTPNVEVADARATRAGVELDCRHTQQDEPFTMTTERVVAATGYAPRRPAVLDPMTGLVRWDEQGRYQVGADFRVALAPEVTGALYVQNAETHAHGVGAPDLGLGAYRSSGIVNSVTGRRAYALPDRTAFTTFGAPPG